MVDGQVQVLEHEGDAALGAKVGDPVQRVARLEPHRSRHDLAGRNRKSAFAEAGAVKVEAGDIQALADLDRFARRGEQRFCAFVVGEPAACVARHGGKDRAGLFQHSEIMGAPVPDADLEAKLRETPQAPFHRFVPPKHFGAGGKRERLGHVRLSDQGRDQGAPSALSQRGATSPPWIVPIGAASMILNRTPFSSSARRSVAVCASPKKEYTFHIDLGIEFLFHSGHPE